MGDWTQDPPVLTAIHDFAAAQALWRQLAPADGILAKNSSAAQKTAFAQMRAADRAYVVARDRAIHRVGLNFSYDEPTLRWPADVKVSLSKSQYGLPLR